MLFRLTLLVLHMAPTLVASSYDDRPMNEDEYFGARMQEHYQGQGLYQEPQGGRGRYALILGALAGVGIEWFWTSRSLKKTKERHIELSEEFASKWTRERDALVSRRTYPVKLLAHELEEADLQLMQLVAAAEDAGVDSTKLSLGGSGVLGRSAYQDTLEYEEFKQPDANNDDIITKQEFNQYIRKFLLLHPETPESDIPRFEEFDINRDGVVTFDEWQYFLEGKRQMDPYGNDNNLINDMYDAGAQAQGFNSMSQNLHRAQGRGMRY